MIEEDGGKGAAPNPVVVPNQKLGEDPAKDHDLKVVSEGAEPTEKPENPEAETAADGGDKKPVTEEGKPATTSSSSFSKGLLVSEAEAELQKRKARAEKFGIAEDSKVVLSESEKQIQRAKRFGTGGSDAKVGVQRLDEALPERTPRKRGRSFNDQGGRGGKRHSVGGDRNRQTENSGGGGQASWSEKDLAAMEARKKRFAAAA